MKKIPTCIILFVFLFNFCELSAQSFIHVDQFGYFPNSKKVAVLSDPQEGFNANDSYTPSKEIQLINNATQEVIFSGSAILMDEGNTDLNSGDRGWHFDFSSIKDKGEYFIEDAANNVRSAIFEILTNPYKDVLKAASKMFYYNRCNMNKVAPFAADKWTDGMNFDKPLQDFNVRYIFDKENALIEKDLSGGWFDAGDYNKYISFTFSVVHNLLTAYENNPHLFGDDWNIPESENGIPDILDELKWELDWMFKMVNEDGSVHNKMGSQNHNENSSSPPSINNDQRFYGRTCSSASATVASTFAHAALVLQNIEGLEEYANQLLDVSMNCFDYVIPFVNDFNLEENCDEGSIVAGDADLSAIDQIGVMVVAAIYLYEQTGDQKYLNFMLNNVRKVEPLSTGFWGPYRMPIQDALVYLDLNINEGLAIEDEIEVSFKNALNNNWDRFFGNLDLDLYRDRMPSWSYHWGSNNPKASYGTLNLLATNYIVENDVENYIIKAEGMVNSFHGVNPLDIVYLSNMYEYGAERSVNEIYHLWFQDGTIYDHALNSTNGPAPGFVSGGPNQNFSAGTISPPSNQPAAKSYLDFNTGWPENSWEISEPAIYYQASYIRLLSEVIGERGNSSVSTSKELNSVKNYSVFPNPSNDVINIIGGVGDVSIRLINYAGQVVHSIDNIGKTNIDISMLDSGMYILEIIDQKTKDNEFLKVVIQR